ncbi:MAG: Gfo/Idh/MocA family oxidoreductase, partial [Patescibacteria group bacterium]|nr:Gfo/Idh/MocA family oxidoreductase [Patescibacteria group bacterium]
MPKLTRRQVLRNGSLAGIALWTTCKVSGQEPAQSPNEKLNLVGIGVGGRGAANVNGCAHENFIALCDVDESRAGATFGTFPQAKKYKDFRKMLAELDKEIDAVVIGTPDHTHAAPGVMAMQMGKHCYCEKPLTHSVHEARVMTEVAAKNKLVTQMGTQIHAGDNYRRAVELVQSGAIGPVAEVHVWLGANFNGPAALDPGEAGQPDAPTDEPAVPEGLDWDLWL